jgi:hypothetical protein
MGQSFRTDRVRVTTNFYQFQDCPFNLCATIRTLSPTQPFLCQSQDRPRNRFDRLLDEINGDTFTHKATELRDRIAEITLKVELRTVIGAKRLDFANRVFELSQALK